MHHCTHGGELNKHLNHCCTDSRQMCQQNFLENITRGRKKTDNGRNEMVISYQLLNGSNDSKETTYALTNREKKHK